jgi:hypothetical protein
MKGVSRDVEAGGGWEKYRKGRKRDRRKALQLAPSPLRGFSLFVTPISQRTIPFC